MTRRAEVFRALGAFTEAPAAAAQASDALELPITPTGEDHTRVFGLLLPPHAAIYVGAEGMLGGDAAARVAGFWRALGYSPPADADHLASLLGLYAELVDAESREGDPTRKLLRHEARVALLWEHLLVWAPVYATKVAETSTSYEGWARLLITALLAEAVDVGTPEVLPLHAREAPGWPSTVPTSAEFSSVVLAPIRSGIVLTRDDLVRAGRELGLGVRIGERAYILRALLGQDALALTQWLVEETRTWQAHHALLEAQLGCVGRFWKERAAAAELALCSEVEAVEGVVARGSGS